MKFSWSRARALLVGVALIAVTNAVVLAGVAYNRSGEPEAVLELTERELQLRNWSWPSNENSSIDLHLVWRISPATDDATPNYWYGGLHWLQPAQLAALGFDVSGNMELDRDAQRVSGQPSRRAWLVLEYDGPAQQAAIERARQTVERATELAQANAGDEEFSQRLETARRQLVAEELFQSRLFVIDAGLDEDALRARYPDRRHYVIVRGRLDVDIQGPIGRMRPVARVSDIDVDAIRVPYEYREIVEPLLSSFTQTYDPKYEPRFAATVSFGRRFEPWIVNLQSLQEDPP